MIEGMPGGRPFRIDREELKKKMLEYLDSDGYKTITAFCVANRISRSHLYKMASEDDELKDISEQIALMREQHLETGGLSGDLNAGMAKFALSQMGWSEKQEIKNETVQVNVNQKDIDRVT